MQTSYDFANKLQNEFREFNLTPQDQISRDDLFSILDQKLGRIFDRNVAEQLYDRMQKNYDGSSTIEEFISVVGQANEVLSTKISNSQNYLEDFHRQRRNAANKLEEVRRTEIMNSYKIMQDSMLNVIVMEAQIPENFFSNNNQALCLLQISDQSFQTELVHKNKLEWNQAFNFNIITGQESLTVRVLTSPANNQQSLSLGVVIISLKLLEDQQKHEEWVQLHSEETGEQIGAIQLGLQWLHSRTKYLAEVVKKWDEQIKNQDEDLNDYQRDLNIIYEPFKSLRNNYSMPAPQVNTQDFPQLHNQLYVQQEPYEQLRQSQPVPQYDFKQYSPDNNNFNQNFSEELKPGAVRNFFETNNEFFLQRIILIIIFFLAILLSFYKNTLIDMIVFTIFLNFNLKNEMNQKKNIIAMTVALGIIFFQELIWIIGLSPDWWSNENKKTDFSSEAGIKKYTVVFSYFQLIAKLIGLALFGKLLLKSQQQGQPNNQQWQNAQAY